VTILIPPRAPNLPLATPEYGRAYQDQYSNALRLYFNQVDNTNAALLGPAGGRYVRIGVQESAGRLCRAAAGSGTSAAGGNAAAVAGARMR
jgi:hypothetical protein